jgi:hypothetical protein
VIFANIEDIMLWSAVSNSNPLCITLTEEYWQTFFSDLESRQKECRLYIDRIGDIVKRHATSLDVYTPYCLNQVIGNTGRTLY